MTEPFPVLQRLTDGWDQDTAYVAADADNILWGRLPTSADRPVCKLEPGHDVIVDTISHEGLLEDQGRDPVTFFARYGVPHDQILQDAATAAATVPHDAGRDGPHVITGPVAIAGARPGDLLAIHILELTPRSSYGLISSRHGKGALPGEIPRGPDPVFTFCRAARGPDGPVGSIGQDNRITFPLRLFLGIMGVAQAAAHHQSSIPPGRYGGNIDLSLLTAGSTLYLPVQVPDALFYVGDPHFAQGDGEVALTAFEAPLRARLRFALITQGDPRHATSPYAETPEYLIPIGLDEDLSEAMRACVRNALDMLDRRYGLDVSTAYAYLSAAADFSVSQVVDQVQGIHARIRKADLTAADRHRAAD